MRQFCRYQCDNAGQPSSRRRLREGIPRARKYTLARIFRNPARERMGSVPRSRSKDRSWCIATSISASNRVYSHVAWRRCLIMPAFGGVLNISSCRSDLDRAAHHLAFAVAVGVNRRIESSIFRRRFRTSGLRPCPVTNGNGLLAYDDDRRIVGACRRGRSILGLTNAMIQSGINLSRFIQLDEHSKSIGRHP